MPARCLPLGVGNVRLFGKVIEAVKLAGAVIDSEHRGAILALATERSPAAAATQTADVILHKDNRWLAHDTHVAAAVATLEAGLQGRFGADKPLQGRIVLIVGTGALAQGTARGLKGRGCALVIASHDKGAAHALAQELGCRYVAFEALYTTTHDVLVVCAEERAPGKGPGAEAGVHPGYLRPGMTVLDLTGEGQKTSLVREAAVRGCAVVTPQQFWLEQTALQARLLTGLQLPRQVLAEAAPWLFEEQ
jgi:shikimate 5-dehydrogenase